MDEIGVVVYVFGFVQQVVWVYVDVVVVDQFGVEWQEVLFVVGCIQYVLCVDIELVEDQCQFVDQCDVDVVLDVFDYFGGFGYVDGWCWLGVGVDDVCIQCVDYGCYCGC